MAEAFFEWASKTPAANVILIFAMCVVVSVIVIATILCVLAFFARVPFELFGFKVWTSGLTNQTGTQDLNVPPDWHEFESKKSGYPGDRSLTTTIQFSPSFNLEPKVIVSMSKVDVANIARIKLEVMNITPQSFTLRYGTWEDTRLYQLSVSWLAVGR